MSHSCEVHAVGSAAILVRRGTGPDAARLRATGERLTAAAHPGVVEVVGSSGSDEEWELQLVHAGRPIDLVGALSVEQVAAAAAAVAAILADLHAAGIVHGSIEASHVLIGSHGRPVLCGLGAPPALAARPEDDVAALGSLIVALLGPDAELEPIPERRWRRHPSWAGWARRSLLMVADQACAEPATRRPNARRLATAIADAIPGAVAVAAPGRGDPVAVAEPSDAADPSVAPEALHADVDESPQPVRLSTLVCAVLGVLVLGAAALRVAQPAARPSLSPLASVAPAPVPLVATTLGPTTNLAPTTTVSDNPATACSAMEPPPPGCGEPIRIEGTTVVVGERHYEVGRPGDRVVVGDWDGDGMRTAAVLRSSTGEVFVFAEWATDRDVVARATATVEGAVELLVSEAGDRDQLLVGRADGSRHPIPTAGLA